MSAAIDAVPRLLVGGYDFPFNVAAGMLVGPLFEGLEIALVSILTMGAAALAFVLTRVIAIVT
jgi:hypothetical protein